MRKSSVIKSSLIVYVNNAVGDTKIIFLCGCEQVKRMDKDKKTIFGYDIPSLCILLAEPRVSQFIIEDTLILKSLCSTPKFPAFGIALFFHRGGEMLRKEGYVDQYFRLLKLLLRAYRREELRVGYLSEQREILRVWNAEAMTWKLVERMGREKCRLGKELSEVIRCVRMGIRLTVRINGWVVFGFRCPSRLKNEIEPKKQIKVTDSCVTRRTTRMKFPEDGLMDIKLFLSWTSPRKSLRDIAANHVPSISLIQSLAQHLLDWGAIRIVPKLVDSQIIFSLFRIVDYRTRVKYAEQFPNFPPLLQILEDMKIPRKFSDHREILSTKYGMAREQFNHLTSWLIASNFIKQTQTYIQFLNIYRDQEYREREYMRGIHGEQEDDFSPLKEDEEDEGEMDDEKKEKVQKRKEKKKRLRKSRSVFEKYFHSDRYNEDIMILKKYMRPLPDSSSFEVLSIILPLCDGNHPLQEICAVKNIEEKEIRKVINDFKGVLVTYQI